MIITIEQGNYVLAYHPRSKKYHYSLHYCIGNCGCSVVRGRSLYLCKKFKQHFTKDQIKSFIDEIISSK